MRKKYNKKNPVFRFGYDEQLSYLNDFDVEEKNLDNIQRSYYQYLMQRKYSSKMEKFVVDIASFVSLILFRITLKVHEINSTNKKDLDFIITNQSILKFIPETFLIKKYSIPQESKKNKVITKNDYVLIKKISKDYWNKPYFVLKVLRKIVEYSYYVNNYNIKSVVTSSEYSFTSSILTYYLNKYNVKHVNVMHGEKLIFIRDSFFTFDEMYIWDDFYKIIFKELKCKVNRYNLFLPNFFSYEDRTHTVTIDYTYYLSSENIKQLKVIRDSLLPLKTNGFIVAVRPHPIYSNKKAVERIFKDFVLDIETDISASINRTTCVVSLYSTVLFQSHFINKKVIIDNLSDINKFNALLDLKYIMLNKEHTLLSDEIKSLVGEKI